MSRASSSARRGSTLIPRESVHLLYERMGLKNKDKVMHRHRIVGYDPLDRALKQSRDEFKKRPDREVYRNTLRALLREHIEAMSEVGIVYHHAFRSARLGFTISLARYGTEGREFVAVEETLAHCDCSFLKPTDEVIAINGKIIMQPTAKRFGELLTLIADSPRPLKLTFIQGERRDEAHAEQTERRSMKAHDRRRVNSEKAAAEEKSLISEAVLAEAETTVCEPHEVIWRRRSVEPEPVPTKPDFVPPPLLCDFELLWTESASVDPVPPRNDAREPPPRLPSEPADRHAVDEPPLQPDQKACRDHALALDREKVSPGRAEEEEPTAQKAAKLASPPGDDASPEEEEEEEEEEQTANQSTSEPTAAQAASSSCTVMAGQTDAKEAAEDDEAIPPPLAAELASPPGDDASPEEEEQTANQSTSEPTAAQGASSSCAVMASQTGAKQAAEDNEAIPPPLAAELASPPGDDVSAEEEEPTANLSTSEPTAAQAASSSCTVMAGQTDAKEAAEDDEAIPPPLAAELASPPGDDASPEEEEQTANQSTSEPTAAQGASSSCTVTARQTDAKEAAEDDEAIPPPLAVELAFPEEPTVGVEEHAAEESHIAADEATPKSTDKSTAVASSNADTKVAPKQAARLFDAQAPDSADGLYLRESAQAHARRARVAYDLRLEPTRLAKRVQTAARAVKMLDRAAAARLALLTEQKSPQEVIAKARETSAILRDLTSAAANGVYSKPVSSSI